jgi:GntR family transcriptional regulator
VIEFSIDRRSGVPPYLQIVQQVRHALTLGFLERGDQLPTVKEAVAVLAVNPNTVLKAYRELERVGLVSTRPGSGTFIEQTLATASPKRHAALRRALGRWLASAREAGLDDEAIQALFASTFREALSEEDEIA